MENTGKIKDKKNFIVRIWNYFTLYEKIWLLVLFVAGIVTTIIGPKLFPDDYDNTLWVEIVSLITLVGGCSCELLLSKQSKWAYVVSFFFYDLTQTVLYAHNGYLVDVWTEILFWMPLLFISFFTWGKHKDKDNEQLTQVKQLKIWQDVLIIGAIAVFSVIFGALSNYFGGNLPYLDAIGSGFNIANGLFLIFRYKEQWYAWYIVAIIEAVQWVIAGQYIMLILSIGYLTNSTYGLIKWNKYVKEHASTSASKTEPEIAKQQESEIVVANDAEKNTQTEELGVEAENDNETVVAIENNDSKN